MKEINLIGFKQVVTDTGTYFIGEGSAYVHPFDAVGSLPARHGDLLIHVNNVSDEEARKALSIEKSEGLFDVLGSTLSIEQVPTEALSVAREYLLLNERKLDGVDRAQLVTISKELSRRGALSGAEASKVAQNVDGLFGVSSDAVSFTTLDDTAATGLMDNGYEVSVKVAEAKQRLLHHLNALNTSFIFRDLSPQKVETDKVILAFDSLNGVRRASFLAEVPYVAEGQIKLFELSGREWPLGEGIFNACVGVSSHVRRPPKAELASTEYLGLGGEGLG